MSKKQVCPYQLDDMINCNENENYNDKTDHINEIYRAQNVGIETNIENTVCLSKAISLAMYQATLKQHLRLNLLKS